MQTLRLSLASLHLLALVMGLGGLWTRARSLGFRPLDMPALRRAFTGDNWWGIAAVVWISTGLWRLFAGTEKVTSYYLHNEIFLGKMRIFGVIFILELWPMITLIRWRRAARRDTAWMPDETTAGRMKWISYTEIALLLAMLVSAVAMARGFGYRGTA